MQIVMIGAGNVATVLCRLLHNAGHTIQQVYSRSLENAAELAHDYKSNFTASINELAPEADAYIIAVSDDAVPQVVGQFPFRDKLMMHTAASVSKDVFLPVTACYGVLYPLQSLRKQSLPAQIPILIDGSTPQSLSAIQELAGSISDSVGFAGDEERVKLHVAAVMVSNFTNHLYALADLFCKEENLHFNLLLPLIAETAKRLESGPAQSFQTGPAIRHDQRTINRHLQWLEKHPHIRRLYKQLTESIQQYGKSGI